MTKLGDVLDLAGNPAVNAADPVNPQDLTTQAWVQAAIAAVGGLDPEAVQDLVAAMLVAGGNVGLTYNDAAGTLTVALTRPLDADTLGGSTLAQVIAAAIAGVVDSAPGTLDTLNELAAALGDDPNFAATTAAALAAKSDIYSVVIGDGVATSFNVDHNLNSTAVTVQVWETGGGLEKIETTVKQAAGNANRVVVSFAAAPANGAYRVVVQG
jgi:hypothetical protein